MNTKRQTKRHVGEAQKSLIKLVVTGRDNNEISAEIWPTLLTETLVSALVSWEGTDVITSMIRAQGDESVQRRWLTLAYAASGPECEHAIPTLSAENWAFVRMTMPAAESPDSHIQVELCRANWLASLTTSPASSLDLTLEIPAELRCSEVGTVLFEMTSQLLGQLSRLSPGPGKRRT